MPAIADRGRVPGDRPAIATIAVCAYAAPIDKELDLGDPDVVAGVGHNVDGACHGGAAGRGGDGDSGWHISAGRAGLVGVGRVAVGVEGIDPVVVGRVRGQSGVGVAGGVGTDSGDLRPDAAVRTALDAEPSFVDGVVGPGQVDLVSTGCCGDQVGGRRRRRADTGQPHDGHSIVLHARVGASPGHVVLTVIPGVVNVHPVGTVVITDSNHGMAGYVEHDGPAGIDLGLVLIERESLGVAVIAVDVLVVHLGHGIAPGLVKELDTIAAVHAVNVIALHLVPVQRAAIGKVVEGGAPVDVAMDRLVGLHEIAGAIPVFVLRPIVDEGVGPRFTIDIPVVVDVPQLGALVKALMRGTQRTLASPVTTRILPGGPGAVVQRHDTAIGRPGVDVGKARPVVVAGYHRGRSGRAAERPIKGRHAGDYVDAGGDVRSRQCEHGRPGDPRWGIRRAIDHRLVDSRSPFNGVGANAKELAIGSVGRNWRQKSARQKERRQNQESDYPFHAIAFLLSSLAQSVSLCATSSHQAS